MVLFSGEAWCAPCRAFRPHFDKAAEKFIHVDVDVAEPKLLTEYGIQGVPSVHGFNHGEYKGIIKGRTIMKIIPEIEAYL